ncbi:hypothetical protein LOTGIDRAFT_111611 [Lottia gigantea]|uniref:Tyrosine-protein kinase ephrin type A/B receptor-like domain-containing protein n=1 Tax=Lottia gigantea TaxID=225164 RepID=V4AV73_LOTGI|nr:hypothetical protein LOTGIDRAFT_111611 [Lottia gigantea]ESP01228.1 hypothetical protein LOTGIDRAFT_111611 [Lottia gigantea]
MTIVNISGYYCDGLGLVQVTNPCDEGYYCPEGQTTAAPVAFICPQGFNCPTGSDQPIMCPRGFYQFSTGMGTCDQCPSRFYCDPYELGNTTGIINPVDCPVGHYCPLSTGYKYTNPCPPGTFSNTPGFESSGKYANECIPCDPGYYCPSQGLIKPYAECTAGYYCEVGSPEPAPVGQSYGYLCPVGHYCPQGTPVPVPCSKGTYQPQQGAGNKSEDCIECPPGYYCQGQGNTNPTGLCDPGFFCTAGSMHKRPFDPGFLTYINGTSR